MTFFKFPIDEGNFFKQLFDAYNNFNLGKFPTDSGMIFIRLLKINKV